MWNFSQFQYNGNEISSKSFQGKITNAKDEAKTNEPSSTWIDYFAFNERLVRHFYFRAIKFDSHQNYCWNNGWKDIQEMCLFCFLVFLELRSLATDATSAKLKLI